MYLTICLRKEVESIEQGQNLMDIVVQRLQDHSDVEIAGSVNETLLNGEE